MIICATHFSHSSSDAVEVSVTLARRGRCALTLATVLADDARAGVEEVHRRSTAPARLEWLAGSLRAEGLDAVGRLLQGPVGPTLGALSRELQAELLVVGDSQRQHEPLFTTALDELATQVPVPVLVMRDVRPFLRWDERPLKVLALFDTATAPEPMVAQLARLAEFGALEVLAVHVWTASEEALVHDGAGAGLVRELWASAEQLSVLPWNVRHRVRLDRSSAIAADAVVRLAMQEEADLVMLTSWLPGAWLPGAHDVLIGAPMSMLLMPASPPVPLLVASTELVKLEVS